MTTGQRSIQRLIYTPEGGGDDIEVKVRFAGQIRRGLGIWPEQVTCFILEDEMANLPTNRGSVTVDIILAQDDATPAEDFKLIRGWRIINVTPSGAIGSTDGNSTVRPVEFMLTLEDTRRFLQGQRGGILLDGLLNRTLPDGTVKKDFENADLVTKCIEKIKLTYREGLPLNATLVTDLNDYDPPADVEWYGAAGGHAPTELQRILEATRHAFAFNQDGSYSIVRLADPGEPLTAPDIPPGEQLPTSTQTITPEQAQKCIIASCPTRILCERKRNLSAIRRPMQWVGIDVDGSILPLQSLSWWPLDAMLDPLPIIDVFNNQYADVADDFKNLARRSIYRMLRLHDDDIAEGWTLTRRVVTFQGDLFGTGVGNPFASTLKAKRAVKDDAGLWVNGDTLVPVEMRLDLELGVVIVQGDPLVKLTASGVSSLHGNAVEFGATDIEFVFGALLNNGNEADYFMVPYEWDDVSEMVIETVGVGALQDALNDANNVPVYCFDWLQQFNVEEPVIIDDGEPQNEDDLKDIALKLASALLIGSDGQVEVRHYVGFHDGVDPSSSVSMVIWDPNNFETTVVMNHHLTNDSDYITRIYGNRTARGGATLGTPVQGQTRGQLRGRSASLGPGSGAQMEGHRESPGAQLPGGGAAATGNLPHDGEKVFIRIDGSTPEATNDYRWTYTCSVLRKTTAGNGTTAWVSSGETGNAYNLAEQMNDVAATTLGNGILITEMEDATCPMEMRPIPDGRETEATRIAVDDGAGGVLYEFIFEIENGVWTETA